MLSLSLFLLLNSKRALPRICVRLTSLYIIIHYIDLDSAVFPLSASHLVLCLINCYNTIIINTNTVIVIVAMFHVSKN